MKTTVIFLIFVSLLSLKVMAQQFTPEQRMMLRTMQEAQRRYDENSRYIESLLSWINELKAQTSESIFHRELNSHITELNSLYKSGNIHNERRLIAAVERKIEASIINYNQRVEELNRAKAEQNNPENIISRGVYLIKNENISDAIIEFRELQRLYPDNPLSYFYIGYCYFLYSYYEEAIAQFSRAIALSRDAVFFEYKGWSEYYLGNYINAVQDFTTQISLSANNPIAFYNRGQAKCALNDYRGAVLDYQKAIELDPEFSMAYNNWGWVYFQRKDYESAINYFNKSIELDGSNYVAYDSRCETYYMLGRYSEALVDCKMALSLNSSYANSYLVSGLIYSNSERKK